MKVVFVRPKPLPETIGLQHLMLVEPLELEILAGLIKDIHEVKIIDMFLEKKELDKLLKEDIPDVVCVTGYINHVPAMIDACKKTKRISPEILTIVGGVHVELNPENFDNECIDFRVVRNATRVFPLLIEHIYNKRPIPGGVLNKNQKLSSTKLPDLDFYLPLPDRSLTERYRRKYFYVFHNRVALMKTSCGCPCSCNFCYSIALTEGKFYQKPLREIIEELQTISEKEVYIVDDNFLLNTNRLLEFIELLKTHDIHKKFLVYGRADFIAANPDVIMKFRKAGLRSIVVGLESFFDNDLKSFNKNTTTDINIKSIGILNKYGVNCYAALIIPPWWKHEDFKKAGSIMQKLGIRYVNLQPLTPLKGLQIGDEDHRLIVSRDDFARWDLAHVILEPEHMSVSEFYKCILNLYQRLIFHPRHLLSHLKYPLRMQLKVARGLIKVRKQYTDIIRKTE